MSCSLSIALLCLDLSGLYIDAAVSAADAGVETYLLDRTHVTREQLDGHISYVGSTEQLSLYDRRARNPYGRLAIGYEQTFFLPELKLYADVWHESSLATGRDRGVNGARIGLRWYPWGGAR